MSNEPVEPLDIAYLKSLESMLSEWSSPEDEAAFGDLDLSSPSDLQA